MVGMVIWPVVTTLEMTLPDSEPKKPLDSTGDLGRAAARAAHQGDGQRHEEFAAAGDHERRAEDQEADQQRRHRAHRHADDALDAHAVSAQRLGAGPLLGPQRNPGISPANIG